MKLAREQEGSCDNLEPHEQDHVEQELEEPQATASSVDAFIYKIVLPNLYPASRNEKFRFGK
jgi:hypothetical protein